MNVATKVKEKRGQGKRQVSKDKIIWKGGDRVERSSEKGDDGLPNCFKS